MNYLRLGLHLILIILLASIQLAFIQALPLGFNYLNIVLVILVFILILFDLNLAILWWLLSAWLFDILSFNHFGVYLIVFTFSFIILYWLLINFFTNRSLYSTLFLIAIATLLHDLGLQFINWLLSFLTERNITSMTMGWWIIEVKRLLFNIVLSIIFFYALNFISHRFRPVFLRK